MGHSANLQPAAYVANTKFLSVFSLEAQQWWLDSRQST